MSDSRCIIDTKSKSHTSLKVVLESLLAFSLLLFSSCAHYRCDPTYVGPKMRSTEILRYYSYPKKTIETEIKTINEKKRYVVKRIEFPSALNVFGTENIKIDYYAQRKHGKFPTILILPISGGIDFCVRSFASHFVSSGFNCAIVHNRKADLEDAKSGEDVEDYFRQTVLDNRQVLDYLVAREEVDEDRLGCLGLSLGGIKASLITGVDERVKCVVLGLAGGSIADIFLLSKAEGIKDYSKDFVEDGVTLETIHTELSEKVETDPIKLAGYMDARNVLIYLALFDRVIPRKCGYKLWEAIGKPELVCLFAGHYSSYLYLPYVEMETLSFFKKKFGLK
jgi:hypothetical protein